VRKIYHERRKRVQRRRHQAVVLYGSETWATTTQMIHRLEMFHRRCARSTTGQHIRPNADGTWHYPSTLEVFQKAGLEPIELYIKRRQHNVKSYLNPRSNAVRDIKEFIDLDFNLERAIWWKPESLNFSLTPRRPQGRRCLGITGPQQQQQLTMPWTEAPSNTSDIFKCGNQTLQSSLTQDPTLA
jgi:hypothetical protein